MTNGDYRTVAVRIRQELVAIAEVAGRAESAWRHASREPDDYRVDAAALNLHGLYAGLERVFVLVAERIDSSLPSGANWHQELVRQMTLEIPGVRPSAISEETSVRLDPYRGFRHVVRNVYAYVLDPRRVGELVEALPALIVRVNEELLRFADALEAIATAADEPNA
jgi:hypothetical protein